ncbi:uncharacterized protein [Littorina saxatilis]|uniref:uncharacterized protein n=1 Tax=Littorina saxatilis TaxID=31220 RepID=UPI0038B45EF5
MGLGFLLLVAAVAAPVAVWTQITTGPPCEQYIYNTCLNSTDTAYQKHIDELDFVAACAAFKQVSICYSNALQQPTCKDFTTVIDGLKAKNEINQRSFCPNGQPNKCLTDLGTCLHDYNLINNPNDKNLCAAAIKALNCTKNLHCPASLGAVIGTKQMAISQKLVMSSGCIATDSNSGACLADAARCLNPLEKQTLAYEQAYDFDGLCGIWPNIRSCFDKLNADANCTSAKNSLDNKMVALTQRYHQYCDVNDQPLACMQALQNCTAEYKIITGLPQFTIDPLYMCQGLETMISCMGTVKADLATCPGIAGIKAIADLQQDKTQTDTTCSLILSPCTTDVSKCVLNSDIDMNDALHDELFDRACTITNQLKGCVDKQNFISGCYGNTFLTAESAYVKNISAMICQGGDAMKAKVCLEHVSDCESTWVNAAQNFKSVEQLCNDQVTLYLCLNKITCTDSATQAQLVALRQKAHRDECAGGICLEQVGACENSWITAARNFTSVGQLCSDQATLFQCMNKITCTDSATQAQLVTLRQKAHRDECNGGSIATVSMASTLTLLVVTVLRLVVV